jgi:glycosyltransferase involved in cell wall biosynthesis
MPRLLYVVNIPRFFVSHRLPLALGAQSAGYEVHVATSDDDPVNIAKIHEASLPFHPLPLAQHGTNPLKELATIRALYQLYRTLQPDIVHQVASRLSGRKGTVSAMSGLGYVFIGNDPKRRVIRQIVQPMMRYALGGQQTRMIFQNPDDQQRFVELGMIPPEKTTLIKGSGVDTDEFVPTPEPVGTPIVLFAGRLMWQKGLAEFVEAARQLRGKARFVVVGYAEKTSPDTVPVEQLQAWADDNLIEWWGKRDDMPAVFAQSHVVCLPSTYGEGVPKVLIEAASCGRAVVTTDTPGCREIVRDGDNGLLVPPKDSARLGEAILKLLDDVPLRQRMGARGRERVLQEFSLSIVIQQMLTLYKTLL